MSAANFSDQVEAFLTRASLPLKPYLPVIARFLLVVTFLEDAIRISGLAEVFLGGNVAVMIVCSVLAILKRNTEIAVGGLFAVIVSQALGYGLIFDSNFFFRNLSVAGGLVMLLADAQSSKRKPLFAGLPTLNENDKHAYLQLLGRVLLVFLFINFVISGEFSILRLVVTIVSLIGCVMVVVGFKAKISAWILVAFLSISNVVLNNWWSLHQDFLKYDFFQTLSIMGGFLLLANLGAGGYSMDEKKKNF
ncbi:ER-derived vesicles protein erv29 [Polyrhizophydium stewartii]|uniref:ER-derived vesicles protein erv29 n=1 Tax=Polyrhizophydium stewartii TaxID=2732419 RepID=A0ABR4NJL2_9FUNG|nr:hypothetical protein HK105_000433 [Polyrhizophydium stewartii]